LATKYFNKSIVVFVYLNMSLICPSLVSNRLFTNDLLFIHRPFHCFRWVSQ